MSSVHVKLLTWRCPWNVTRSDALKGSNNMTNFSGPVHPDADAFQVSFSVAIIESLSKLPWRLTFLCRDCSTNFHVHAPPSDAERSNPHACELIKLGEDGGYNQTSLLVGARASSLAARSTHTSWSTLCRWRFFWHLIAHRTVTYLDVKILHE